MCFGFVCLYLNNGRCTANMSASAGNCLVRVSTPFGCSAELLQSCLAAVYKLNYRLSFCSLQGMLNSLACVIQYLFFFILVLNGVHYLLYFVYLRFCWIYLMILSLLFFQLFHHNKENIISFFTHEKWELFVSMLICLGLLCGSINSGEPIQSTVPKCISK